jgi:2-amino-4-hydroxy-6-hydroxymethyldihydropteridine diphosphokinase
MHARAFVLYPLRELAPDLVLPGHGRVADLAAACAGQVIERLHSG